MSFDGQVRQFIPGHERELLNTPLGLHVSAMLGLGRDESVSHLFMTEFGPEDGWSLLMREAIENVADTGVFDSGRFLDLGIGDGRNVRKAAHLSIARGVRNIQMVGVDKDGWKLALSYRNFTSDSLLKKYVGQHDNLHLYEADAVDYILRNGKGYSGTAFICLPQSEGSNGEGTTSDIDRPWPSHQDFDREWAQYAFRLNAAVLTRLRQTCGADTKALLTLSGRIPSQIRDKLINRSGWNNLAIVAQGRVWQDFDTPISWMRGRADLNQGDQFFDQYNNPIETDEAVEKHINGEPIQHDVFIYLLKPR
ncbi:hypothetical protein A2866_00525 [Candidatus Roizmanbacteria bacterium RIFCSPHIGHO2_01_FULL_39_8]|uniref:Histidine-specific methyltransferase SAM-dependent domain-containing protein n=3 Tax=Candidatus Roizmaniibacteriota TaxID=1752723 RepID=A0A1F7GG49_9BACT|nr:MAG: hypothetical protein A2866_00525 [Candidatus Roizmanbacteria bacterium RIFCSPHIGHO2_01_FULL_39_8]OGK28151.1 MAG: hypothetical protein A3C28_05635 [Candidatus Roizmanbacteria bacterium RIFCSPHIGHO2_02_FULL_39_9]OGK37181.1 MAG: hypothetical protein A3F60_03665 [Candidatus Roizmanbacteria bacterium RIFCSPHIGHO2_12_FULL_39_8]